MLPLVNKFVVSGSLPSEKAVENDSGVRSCVFLHDDTSKRPYPIEDFRQPLQDAGVLKDISGNGAYQMMSHLWLVRFRTQEAKDAVLAAGGLSVKGGYCVIIDPCRQEIKVKIHWAPFHIPGKTTFRKALSELGEVMEVRYEEKNVPGFESAESTTRVARMVLKEGVTAEELPHLFKFHGGSVLVVVPGAASEDRDDKEDIMDIEEAETTVADDRCMKSASDEQGSVCDGIMKTSSETPKEQGDVSNAAETPPMSDQASAMNAEAEPVQDDRASQDDSFGLAKRAKTMLPPSSQPSTEVGLQRLERQWLRATGAKG
ncbi:hypothetical protein V5799_031636, partial [Amblyomma americanum]